MLEQYSITNVFAPVCSSRSGAGGEWGHSGPGGGAVQEARSWSGAQSVIRGLAARRQRQSIEQLMLWRKVSTATSGCICFTNPAGGFSSHNCLLSHVWTLNSSLVCVHAFSILTGANSDCFPNMPLVVVNGDEIVCEVGGELMNIIQMSFVL